MADPIRSSTRSFLRGDRRTPPPAPSIDGYRIERHLGTGPLTSVYAAVLESHQQPVALKVLLPHLAGSEVFVQRFLQTANAARLVTDARVLPCYDVGQSHGNVYLATELFEGRTLGHLVEAGPLDRARVIYFVWQAALGLESIHQAGLVHGNVRPANILIDDEDGVRLADLGLPAAPDGADSAASTGPAAFHLAPECIRDGQAPGALSDVYALGMVLLGAVAGRNPWEGLSRGQLSERHAAFAEPLHACTTTGLDADLLAVIARATASRPQQRYQHIWHLREDLERLQYGFAPIHARAAGSSTGPQPAVVTPVAPPRRRPVWLLPAVGLAAVAVGLGAWLALREPTPVPEDPVPAPAPAPAVVASAPAQPAAAVVPPEPRPAWATAAGRDANGRWAVLAVGQVEQRFRWCSAGSFWMGSGGDEEHRAGDEERHLVTLTRPFWMADTEVTQALWAVVAGTAPGHFRGEQHPVDSISWNDAQDFLARLGTRTSAAFRLPTEAEWEFACRAGGAAEPGWSADDGITGTRAVGQRPSNAWGIHDMLGNVAEWCEDTYGRYHREAITDPLATGGVHRVVRGGAWNDAAATQRAAARGRQLPVTRLFTTGMRIAISD